MTLSWFFPFSWSSLLFLSCSPPLSPLMVWVYSARPVQSRLFKMPLAAHFLKSKIKTSLTISWSGQVLIFIHSASLHVYHVYVWCLKSWEGTGRPGPEVVVNCELPCGGSEQRLSARKQVLLAAEPFLQLLTLFWFFWEWVYVLLTGLNLLCRQCWPWSHRDIPAVASWMLGLKACASWFLAYCFNEVWKWCFYILKYLVMLYVSKLFLLFSLYILRGLRFSCVLGFVRA